MPEVVTDLPTSLTSLTYFTDYLNSTVQNQLNFTHLTNLTNLQLTQDKSDILYCTTWNREDMFYDLVNLETIGLTLRNDKLPSRVFLPLARLRVIDLSNGGFLRRGDIEHMLVDSKIKDKPLEELRLSMATNPWDLENSGIDLKGFLPLLAENSNLTVLDLSNNGFVQLWPGAIKYLPNVKVR